MKALDYNVPHGKKIRGLTVAIAYKDLMVNEPLTPEKIRQAHILGWCIEIVSKLVFTQKSCDHFKINRSSC